MKRYISLIGLLICLFVWNACVDEDVVKKQKDVIDGIPTTVSLSFATTDANKVNTKSAIPTSEEYRVYDLYVFVFKQEGGNWIKELSTEAYTSDSNKSDDGTGETTGRVTLNLTSGTKRIYAIANGKDNPLMSVAGIESITNLNELLALTALMERGAGSVERGQSHLLMSGVFETVDGDNKITNDGGEITISPEDNGEMLNGKIVLNHVDSKITFDVTTAEGISFTPKEWRVINVPYKSYTFEKEWNSSSTSTSHDAVGYESKDDYFDTDFVNFNTAAEGGVSKGGSFTFYMLENRKSALGDIKKDANDQGVNPYQLREKENKDIDGKNLDYKYAPKYATYVEITGSFRQEATSEDVEKSAEVKYTIHLGYEGDDATNFGSRRGCDYTYHVKVAGVDNIELEVETSDQEEPTEKQPGAEGSVVKSKTYIYVDAHYDTKSITFEQGKITESATFTVKAPYYNDYKWVWFVQNDRQSTSTDYETYNFYYDKGSYKGNGRYYPADEVEKLETHSYNETKGYISKSGIERDFWWNSAEKQYYKQMKIKIPSTSSTTSFEYKKGYVPYPKKETGKRLNIEQLIGILKYETFKETTKADKHPLPEGITEGINYQSPLFDKDGNATFTVFIDEFYYQDKATDWKNFVNVPNREMHILCDTKYSKDEESSLTTSNFLISQRSIKTFYDPSTSITAWGVETIREGEKLKSIKNKNNSDKDKSNGRANMLFDMEKANMLNDDWTAYMDLSKNEMKSSYNKVEYACLQRNRDSNGNGRIDPEEVKWYLPAINQLTGMWIGRDGFSSMEVYLFNGDTKKITTNDSRRQYHFMSSNYIMFWAEEGAATGNYDIENHDNFDYRCVRNLGFREESETNIPSDYVDYKDNVFDLTRMNSKAIRTEFYTTELAVTDELNQANRPHKYFQVAKDTTKMTITQQNVYNGDSPCKDYSESGDDKGTWRMPNHRELCLIQAYAYKNETSLSRTRSSLGAKVKPNFGSVFYQQAGTIITLDENKDSADFSVRCVKDLHVKPK